MSLWDYLLPWKAIPNMAKDVKKAWEGEGKNRHDSVFGAIGKYGDPFGALMGDNWMEFFHEKIPREVNRAMEPAVQLGHNLNPLYHYGKSNDSDTLNAVHDFGSNKGGDVLAAVLGAVAGGGALLGGAGAGAGGGAGGAGASAFGPYAGGYAFPGGSSFGGMSAYGPYAGSYALPASSQLGAGFGGSAVANGLAGGGAASGAASGGASGGFSNPFANADWGDPQTYMDLYQQYGSLLPQQQQQQQQQPQGLLNMTDPEEERQRYLARLNSYGYPTYGLLGGGFNGMA